MDSSESKLNPHDIFLWPDEFWCYRDERSLYLLRASNYRVIPEDDAEWVQLTMERYGGFSQSFIEGIEALIQNLSDTQDRLARFAVEAAKIKSALLKKKEKHH